VSGDPGLACSSPLLVPILLHGVVLRRRAAVDRRSARSGGGRNGHGENGEYVVRWRRKPTFG
jgi:hypothetical protein